MYHDKFRFMLFEQRDKLRRIEIEGNHGISKEALIILNGMLNVTIKNHDKMNISLIVDYLVEKGRNKVVRDGTRKKMGILKSVEHEKFTRIYHKVGKIALLGMWYNSMAYFIYLIIPVTFVLSLTVAYSLVKRLLSMNGSVSAADTIKRRLRRFGERFVVQTTTGSRIYQARTVLAGSGFKINVLLK